MTAHTPGPWESVPRLHRVGKRARNGSLDLIAELSESVAQRDEGEANARLIAAAPDLLAALRDLLHVIDVDMLIPETVSYMRQARAAIAKATP